MDIFFNFRTGISCTLFSHVPCLESKDAIVVRIASMVRIGACVSLTPPPPASLVTGFYDPRNGELQIDSWNIAKSYGTTTTLGPWAEA